jgi:hypothetical protein
MTAKYTVGQRVWIYDVNGRGENWPKEGEVVKAGRVLIHVRSSAYGPTTLTFRDNGVRNDNYGHQSIKTDDERAEDERRTAALRVLSKAGVRFEWGCQPSIEKIEAIAAIVGGDQ